MGGTVPVLVLSAFMLGGCSNTANAAPTPTPVLVLAQAYVTAANKANQANQALNDRLGRDCKDLDPCKRDFAQYGQVSTTFINELQAIGFPSSMQPDVRAQLDILRRYISLDDDASHARSPAQINSDYDAEVNLKGQLANAADRVRFDLGLPAAPSLTPHPSPTALATAVLACDLPGFGQTGCPRIQEGAFE